MPLDIHSIILYYNKDLLKKAGLLGDDGKPKGLDGVANWDAALAKLTASGVAGLSVPGDNASGWRIFYTLLNQQGGQFLTDGKFLDGDNLDKATTAIAEMQKWVKSGWTPAKTEYPASIALFTSGKAAMHINGVWEVPTMVDLAKKGKLFDWGAIQIPALFDHPATWATRIPSRSPTAKAIRSIPAKRKLVLDTVHWFNEHSLEWAGGGHIPAYLPVQESAAFKALKPNSDYVSLAKTAVFDPVSTLAGVASPVYDAAGNYVVPGDERRNDSRRRRKADARRPAGPDQVTKTLASPVVLLRADRRGSAHGGPRAHGQEQAQRDPRRLRADGAVHRRLRRIVRLSVGEDVRTELHRRAADRRRRHGSASRTTGASGRTGCSGRRSGTRSISCFCRSCRARSLRWRSPSPSIG